MKLPSRLLLMLACSLVSLAWLAGCAWVPGTVFQEHHIHHRNYKLAKQAWHAYVGLHGGPWSFGPVAKDFETGWRQGYYDVASGMDAKLPIVPPRRYWTAKFQNPDGEQHVEAWYAGYAQGAMAAKQDGVGEYALVPTAVPLRRDLAPLPGVATGLDPAARLELPPENLGVEEIAVPDAEPVVPPPGIDGPPAPRRPVPAPSRVAPPTARPAPPVAAPPAVQQEPALPVETAPVAPQELTPTLPEPMAEEVVPDSDAILEPAPLDPATEAPDLFQSPNGGLFEDDTAVDQLQPEDSPPAGPAQPSTAPPPPRGLPGVRVPESEWPPRPSAPRQPGQRRPPMTPDPAPFREDEPLPELGPTSQRGQGRRTTAAERGGTRRPALLLTLDNNRLRLAGPPEQDSNSNTTRMHLDPAPAEQSRLAIHSDESLERDGPAGERLAGWTGRQGQAGEPAVTLAGAMDSESRPSVMQATHLESQTEDRSQNGQGQKSAESKQAYPLLASGDSGEPKSGNRFQEPARLNRTHTAGSEMPRLDNVSSKLSSTPRGANGSRGIGTTEKARVVVESLGSAFEISVSTSHPVPPTVAQERSTTGTAGATSGQPETSQVLAGLASMTETESEVGTHAVGAARAGSSKE